MAEFRVTGAATAATVTPSAVLFGGSIRMAMAAADDQDKCTGKSSRLTIVSFPHQPCLPAVRGLILLVSTFEETDQSPLLYWWWRSAKWCSAAAAIATRDATTRPNHTRRCFGSFFGGHTYAFSLTDTERQTCPTKKTSRRPHPSIGKGGESASTGLMWSPTTRCYCIIQNNGDDYDDDSSSNIHFHSGLSSSSSSSQGGGIEETMQMHGERRRDEKKLEPANKK
jgi:hypothetical protein